LHRHPSHTRILAASLAFAAGYVDAIGFLSLGGFFVSFMSGNSTRLGVGVVEAWPLAARAAELIAAFVIGVAIGTYVGERAAQRPRAVLVLVTGLLLMAALVSDFEFPTVAAAGAALAMGAVNAVFGRDASLPVGLTYVSGTLVRLGESLASSWAKGSRWEWTPYLFHWLALVFGAALGASSYAQLRLNALWVAALWTLILALWCHLLPAPTSDRRL
jgi:uncharacterized membrane protein YoaK (UPF0700 family)